MDFLLNVSIVQESLRQDRVETSMSELNTRILYPKTLRLTLPRGVDQSLPLVTPLDVTQPLSLPVSATLPHTLPLTLPPTLPPTVSLLVSLPVSPLLSPPVSPPVSLPPPPPPGMTQFSPPMSGLTTTKILGQFHRILVQMLLIK